ncbi:MAG TPA: YwbE family protein [Bacteroidia bacterium]|nr:YwbE family protein [Bacteroidia bacterium]
MEISADKKSGQYRANIQLGMEVNIVLKRDQKTGKRTNGKVRWILTSKPFHSHGIKVMLETRQVGRVQEIVG